MTILTITNKEAEYKRFRATKLNFIKLKVSNFFPVGTRYCQCHFLTIMNSRLYIAVHQNALYCAKGCLNNIENLQKESKPMLLFYREKGTFFHCHIKKIAVFKGKQTIFNLANY